LPTGPASAAKLFLGSDAIRQCWQRGAGVQLEVVVRMGRPITNDRVAVEWTTTMIDPDEGEITCRAASCCASA
jgi:hypothetical protein